MLWRARSIEQAVVRLLFHRSREGRTICERIAAMFRNVAHRAFVSVVLVSSLVGCRAFPNLGLFSRCRTCGTSGVETVGDSYVVGGGVIDGGSWGGDAGCTTCQKSPEVVFGGEGEVESDGLPGDGAEYVDNMEPLMLPTPDGSQPSYAVNPTPEEQPIKPEATKPEEPTKPIEVGPPTPRTTVAKPSALNLDVKSSVSSAAVGKRSPSTSRWPTLAERRSTRSKSSRRWDLDCGRSRFLPTESPASTGSVLSLTRSRAWPR